MEHFQSMAREIKLTQVQLMPPQASSVDAEGLCGMCPAHLRLASPTPEATPAGLCPLAEVIPEISAAHWGT